MVESLQAFPNPFQDRFQVVVHLTKESDVQFSLYNLNGTPIDETSSMKLQAGHHTINFYNPNLESGLYLLKTKINNQHHYLRVMKAK